MQFIDLGRQYEVVKNRVQIGINEVLDSHGYIMGSAIVELEERLASFCGAKYCLTCGSGTEALQIPLMAYDLKENDAVFVPAFTFFASAESVNLAGGTPVFVDVDDTFNMDPKSLVREIQRVKTEGKLNPRGVIAVDLFGRSADYDLIEPIVKERDMFLLEDAAQGFGGSLRAKRNGSFGDVGATSFFPAKPLGCYGDGGAIFTDDGDLYELMKSIRVHGHGSDKYDNIRLGINGRMDTIQAAVVLAKLDVFEQELQLRQHIADRYTSRLAGHFKTPIVDADHFSAWAQYTLQAECYEQRLTIMNCLTEKGIPTMIYYPVPLHKQTAYKKMGYGSESLPMSEEMANRVFSIPMHPYLTEEEVGMICENLIAAVS